MISGIRVISSNNRTRPILMVKPSCLCLSNPLIMQIDLGIIKMTVNSGGRYIVHTLYYLQLKSVQLYAIRTNVP